MNPRNPARSGYEADLAVHDEWTESTTLADLLVRAASLTPGRRCVAFYDDALTYGDLLSRSRRVARGLAALGVKRGDHVGILLPNGPEFVEAFFGASYLGAVVVPLNPRYRSSELSHALKSGDLVTLITSGFSDAYTDFPAIVTSCAPEILRTQDVTRLSISAFPHLRSIVLLGGEARDGFIDREQLLRLGDGVPSRLIETARQSVRVRDVGVILYTSGTTAGPKGCLLTHEALTRGPVARAKRRFRTRDHDVTWNGAPVFHMASLQQLLGSIGTNGTFVTDSHFDAGRAIELTRREKPTISWALFPAIMAPILDHPSFNADDFADVRRIVMIGPVPLLQRVQRTFPQAELITLFAMTETAGLFAVSDRDADSTSRVQNRCRPLPGVSVQIVRPDDGEPVAQGERGELLVKGPGMLEGYYDDPKRTAEVLDDAGWLHTGDIFRLSASGELIFEGRIKDMLKVGGENVSAVEIEVFLCTHPDVVEAAVIGVPDVRLDEVPIAFVELRTGAQATSNDILNFCEGRIARYKRPKEVHLVPRDQWPMSATKIDKQRLRVDREQLTASGRPV